jgi:methyl-accepting chemotaxis protein-1 (serine sensor receptor)
MNLNHLKISTRLVILISVLSVMLIAIGGIGLFGISQTNDALKTVYEDRTVPMGQLADVARLNLRNRLAIANSLINPSAEEINKNTAEVEANMLVIAKVWADYTATTLTPQEGRLAKQLVEDRGRFAQEGLHPAIAALRANRLDDAKKLVFEKVRPLFQPVQDGVNALMQLQQDVAKQEFEAATARYTTIRMLSIGSIFLGVLLAVLFGAALIRSTSRALRHAVDIAHGIAQGELNQTITPDGRDEVAQVLIALTQMQDNLAKVVSDVRSGSEGVATASAQIASGNQDLSSRTEQQASAL